MNRETENALLLLLGLATAIITGTGVYTRYVKPSLLPWLASVAVLLILLALSAIIRDQRRREDHCDDHSGHVHQRGIGWLLAIPVVMLAFVTPPALTAKSSVAAVTLSPNELRQPFPPLPEGRAPEISLKQVMKRVALDSAGTLYGRTITLVGFIDLTGHTVDLARVMIFCCAADAQLARVHLAGPEVAKAAELPEDTWIRVEGTLNEPSQSTTPEIPTMTVTALTHIDTPDNTYA